MPAEEHLPSRAAVEEDRGRPALARFAVRGLEELRVDLHSVGRRQHHGFGHGERRGREVGRHGARRQIDRPAIRAEECRRRVHPRVGAEKENRPAPRDLRRPLDALTRGERRGLPSGRRHAPEMAPVDVALVGVEDDPFPVRRQGDVFDLEVSGCQQDGRAAGGRNGVEMRPAVPLPRENEAVAVGPGELPVGHDIAEDAAAAALGAKDLARRARRGVGDADRPGLALAVRPEGLQVPGGRDTQVRDALAVWRPDRPGVAVRRGVEVADRPRCDVEDADEAVIAPAAGEGEPRAVGRPGDLGGIAAGLEGLCRLLAALEKHPPDLVLLHEGHAVAFWRHRRRVPLGELARLRRRTD